MMKHQLSTYHLNPVVAIEDFGERSLALHCEDLRMVELNATARDLLRRLDGEASLEQVAVAIAEEYGQPSEAVLADVQETIAQMVDLDLVISGNHAEKARPKEPT